MDRNAKPDLILENRAMIAAIRQASIKFQITSEFLEDDWLIRLTKDGQRHFVYVYSFDCNSHAGASIAGDKVTTYQLLKEASLHAVPHFLINSLTRPIVALEVVSDLYAQHQELVIKPVRGSRGENVVKPSGPDKAMKYANEFQAQVWAASPYIDIEYELRVVVFAGRVRLAYRKYDAPILNGLKMFNVHLGAKTESVDLDSLSQAIQTLATEAMHAIGLNLGAVDIVVKNDGSIAVLEINSGFSLEHYARMSNANENEVITFYETVIKEMFSL
jgi:glutathione synthase/RimK-type ligase-like ATP-grasp enzyme